jgi:catecholate siderophore receptor
MHEGCAETWATSCREGVLVRLERKGRDVIRKFRQRKTRRGWETMAAWGLSSAVVLGVGGALQGTEAISAQTVPSRGTAATLVDGTETGGGEQKPESSAHDFNVPAGPLMDALNAYAAITGVKLKFGVAANKMATFQSKGVHGIFPDMAAVRMLLEGTGLSAHFEAGGVLEVKVRNEEKVDVTTSLSSTNLPQFNQPLLDTPQTVVAVPQFILQDEQDTTLRDALRNVPGISLAAGEGGSQGDNLTIRGFTARNDIFLDGIRDFGSYYRDAFNYESVDVLEGPAGGDFGRGSTGGVVNQETKQPELKPHLGGTLQLGTNLMRRVTADINEPIESIPGAAFRLNLAGEESNVAGRNYTNVRRFGIAPEVAFGLNSPTRFLVDYLHEGEDDLPDYGLPYYGVNVPHGVPRQTYYGYLENDYFRTNPDIVTGRAEHDFSANLTVRNTLRWANYPRDVNITEPQINTVPVYNIKGGVSGGRITSGSTVTAVCSPTAATPCFPVTTPLSQIAVKRNQLAVNSVEDLLWDQAIGEGHFSVLKVANDFTVIVEGGRERSRPLRPVFTYVYPSTQYTTLLNPNANDFEPAPTAGVKTYVNSQTYGFGFNDTLKLRSWLQASGGVRFDYFNTDYRSGATHLSRLDKQPTYRAALVAKPRPEGSIYFDYGTSFDPSAESLSLSATNAVQPPQYNETYEVGAKWAFLHDRLNANGSVFQTTKTNVSETDPTNSANIIQTGPQRVRGVQFGALGHMPAHFDLILGYAYLSGITVGSQANYSPFASVTAYVNGATTASTVNLYLPGDPVYGQGAYYIKAIGNPFANVPKNSSNLLVTHALWKGFIGGFGFNQVSARRASSTGPIALPQTSAAVVPTALPIAFKVIPGYISFNAMVKRPINEHITFQVNVNNLANSFFIDLPHPGHLIPSEGINAQFGFNYTF